MSSWSLKPARSLVRILHGSHLYGTNTPSSDHDYKGVFLPSGSDILLGRVPRVIDRGTGSDTRKNTKEDIDDQVYPLQKFLGMVAAGDTVGTEILFAPDSCIMETSREFQYLQKNSSLLINRQCEGFVGYCQRQAAKYGVKGSRMASCKGIVELLHRRMQTAHPADKLATIYEQLLDFCAKNEYSSIVDIPAPNGKPMLHLEVVDRKTPLSITLKDAHAIYKKVYDNYGHRAEQALNNKGIDWKAISHAVRVAGQAIELLEDGKITFPRPEADFLVEIKLGKLDFNDVSKHLELLVQQVQLTSVKSILPENTDADYIDSLVLHTYKTQVVGETT